MEAPGNELLRGVYQFPGLIIEVFITITPKLSFLSNYLLNGKIRIPSGMKIAHSTIFLSWDKCTFKIVNALEICTSI